MFGADDQSNERVFPAAIDQEYESVDDLVSEMFTLENKFRSLDEELAGAQTDQFGPIPNRADPR